jgi:hypothetical protein
MPPRVWSQVLQVTVVSHPKLKGASFANRRERRLSAGQLVHQQRFNVPARLVGGANASPTDRCRFRVQTLQNGRIVVELYLPSGSGNVIRRAAMAGECTWALFRMRISLRSAICAEAQL